MRPAATASSHHSILVPCKEALEQTQCRGPRPSPGDRVGHGTLADGAPCSWPSAHDQAFQQSLGARVRRDCWRAPCAGPYRVSAQTGVFRNHDTEPRRPKYMPVFQGLPQFPQWRSIHTRGDQGLQSARGQRATFCSRRDADWQLGNRPPQGPRRSPGSAPRTGQPHGKPPTRVCRTHSASGRHTGPRNTAQELLLHPVWTCQEWVPGTDGAAPGHVPAPRGCPTQRSTSNTRAGGTRHRPSAQGSCVDPTPLPREGTSTEAGRRGIPGVSAAPNPQAGPWVQLSGLGCADAAQPHRC